MMGRPTRFPIIDGHKVCSRCGERKPLSEYHRSHTTPSGYVPLCKACAAKLAKAWNAANRDKKKAWWDAHKEWYRDYRRGRTASRQDCPERTAARGAVALAMKRGDLVRPDHCELCRQKCKPHAHHADYSRPLGVIWLCRPCHNLADRLQAERLSAVSNSDNKAA